MANLMFSILCNCYRYLNIIYVYYNLRHPWKLRVNAL